MSNATELARQAHGAHSTVFTHKHARRGEVALCRWKRDTSRSGRGNIAADCNFEAPLILPAEKSGNNNPGDIGSVDTVCGTLDKSVCGTKHARPRRLLQHHNRFDARSGETVASNTQHPDNFPNITHSPYPDIQAVRGRMNVPRISPAAPSAR